MYMIDYLFRFGKFENMYETIDSANILYKINAFMNLIKLQPGTLQDTPECGVVMDVVLHADPSGGEINKVMDDVKESIMQQCALYIDPDFLENIDIEMVDIPGSEDGSKAVTFKLRLKYASEISIEALYNESGITFTKIVKANTRIDPTPFI